MWNRTIEAQSQLFDVYFTIIREVNQSFAQGLSNAEEMQRSQLELVRKSLERNEALAGKLWNQKNLSSLLVAQSQLAAGQIAEAMDLMRNYVSAVQDSQLATLSTTRERVEQVTEEVRQTAEETAEKAKEVAQGTADFIRKKNEDATKRASKGGSAKQPWTGIERRKATNGSYSGFERRQAA